MALTFLVVSAGVVAQPRGPIDERIIGRRIEVPPISERINIAPLTEGTGAFSAPPGVTSSRIFGIVINELGVIVPSAGVVVVRSLGNGKVIGQTPVDNLGQFSMRGVDPGLYAAELVDSGGTVVTSSPSFTVGIGEIVQLTPVVPQNSIGGLASILGNSTSSTINSAANAGVVAVVTGVPVSP
jgi:hypothetical protein